MLATAATKTTAIAATGFTAPQQRLFDKEADNQHEEPVLLAQLAASQLRALLETDSDAAPKSLAPVIAWASKLAQVWRDRPPIVRRPSSGG
jgi:hypothetical protein